VEAWEQDWSQASAALQTRADEIASFIGETVSFSEFERGVVGRVLEIKSLQVMQIRDIKTPFPSNRPEEVTFSCLVELKVQVVHEWLPMSMPRALKAGDPTDDEFPPPFGLPGFAEGLRRDLVEVGKVIELECQATVDGHGGYDDVEFVSARRRDDLMSEWEDRRIWMDLLNRYQDMGQGATGENE